MIPVNSRLIKLFKPVRPAMQADKPCRQKTLLIAVSDDRFFMSHRLEIGRAAVKSGWRVIVVAGANGCRRAILSEGMEYVALPAPKRNINPACSFRALSILTSLLKRNQNCILHLVGLKMMMLGNLAARMAAHKGGIVNAVSGLGISFQSTDSVKARAITTALRSLWPGRIPHTTIFQNREDEALLRSHGVLTSDENIEYIKGSGVDLTKFACQPASVSAPEGKLRVIFSGRLLRSKGVTDLIEAAEMLRPKWEEKAEFIFCGATHFNPDSLSSEEMNALCDNRYIRWVGHRDDMPQMLASSRIMAFPSYYREGVPKSLIEASAVGLPIITCDSVGCRDTIDGNGVLVEPRNPQRLAEEIDRLLTDDQLCMRLGRRSRELAERDYDVNEVVRRHLVIYSSLYSMVEKTSADAPSADLSLNTDMQCASISA